MFRKISYYLFIFIACWTTSVAKTKPTAKAAQSAAQQNLPQAWYSEAIFIYLLAALVILSLLGLLWLNFRKSKQLRKGRKDLVRIREERDRLSIDVEKLVLRNRELILLGEEDKAQMERLQHQQEKQNLPAEEEKPSPTMEWDKPEPIQKAAEVFYSRFADLQDGFSVSELLESEASDTIFEITLQSTSKASFKVSTNPAAQRYALSNADYFLERPCQYDTLPKGSIINEAPGKLSLSGGKWEIVEKARISFQ